MKTQPSHRKSGFTLVELLVVIAIIAVLAGAGFAAGNAAIQKARRTTALATAIAIESAVNNFYSEYSTMPKEIAGNNDPAAIDTKDKAFVNALLGTETISVPLNPRAIKFLSVKEGQIIPGGGKGGLVYDGKNSTTILGIFDPWGGPFYVLLDGNYDESITGVTTGQTGAQSVTLNGRRCAVYSKGADAKTKGAAADDVTTWGK
jgi:prepilin-type N-terminal cleavage/methylation domain-containing protein